MPRPTRHPRQGLTIRPSPPALTPGTWTWATAPVRADFTLETDSEEISGSPGFDLTMDLIGGSGELYDDHSNCPNFIDNDWGVLDLSAGETSSGDVCLHVPEDDLDGAELMIQTWWHEDEPLFVAID